MLYWSLLLLGIFINTFASLLIKIAMTDTENQSYGFLTRFLAKPAPTFAMPSSFLFNLPLWTGLSLYGIAFLMFAFVLMKQPLNIVHPLLTSCTIVLVAIGSVLVFKEPMHWSTIVGIVLICSGVFFIGAHSIR